MEFICFDHWVQLPSSADELFEQAARDSVFFTRPWLENLQACGLENDISILLACVIDQDKLLALLPLMTSDGQHLESLSNLYSSLQSLLLSEHASQAAVNLLAQGLDQSGMQSLQICAVADDDDSIPLLQQALQARGYQSHQRFRFHNWIHPVAGLSFEAYMALRPSRVRNTIKRKLRKLQREHGYEIRLYSDQNVQQALEDYDSVYRASWKPNEQYPEFIEELARTLSAQGWLRLALLYVDNQPIAAQFWFVVHGKASIFKLVYDQAWKQYSPGSILIAYLIRHVIEIDRVDEIDFLTGNDAYKQDWMIERRQRNTWSFFRPRPAEGKVKRLYNAVKTWLANN